MGVFVQAPFWSQQHRYATFPHAVSVVVTPPAEEPLTRTQAILRAGFDGAWTGGDPRDALFDGFIAAARSKVEQDTGLALLTQTRDVYFDAITERSDGTVMLPAQSLPLQQVVSIKSTDTGGVVNTLDPTNYVVDLGGGRIGLSVSGVWPTDLRFFQPFVVRIISGWTNAAALLAAAPLLVHAVGLLTAHYGTLGRDLASIDTTTEVPFGYQDAIGPYQRVIVP